MTLRFLKTINKLAAISVTRFLIFFLFIFISNISLHCQSVQDEYLEENIEIREFDKKRWKSLSEDIDYSGETREEEEPEPEEPDGEDGGGGSSSSPQVSGISEVFKFIVIGGAIVLVVFILINLLGRDGPRNKKINPVTEMELEEIEEDLENADIDDPLQRAIASGNYTLAVRLYYLALLKELSIKNHIRWKKDKTNGEYIRELSGSSIFTTFRDITLIFERIWYGTVELTEDDFRKIETGFQAAISMAKKMPIVE